MSPSFFRFLLLFALLLLCSSHGINPKVMATSEFGDSLAPTQARGGNFREMIEVMDYDLKPGPNDNPKAGFASPPSSQG